MSGLHSSPERGGGPLNEAEWWWGVDVARRRAPSTVRFAAGSPPRPGEDL